MLFPEGFQAPPARHPAEPVLRVRGQVFLWGESVCPMLPWRQLFLKALVESPEGSSWVGAGAEVLLGWESRGKTPSSSNTGSFVVADTQPWTNLWWRSLHPSCLVASQCMIVVGFNRTARVKGQSVAIVTLQTSKMGTLRQAWEQSSILRLVFLLNLRVDGWLVSELAFKPQTVALHTSLFAQ